METQARRLIRPHRKQWGILRSLRKVLIVSKPEPHYTEEARKNQVTGTVTLRVMLSANGKATNIEALKLLPNGLTEMAARAASHVKFIPVMKDSRRVSQYVQIEYNFNIY